MHDMRELFRVVLAEVSATRLVENTRRLWSAELPQTFDAYQRSAECTAELICEAGIEECEIVRLPADGKTTYQDMIMPLAWNATKGKLTILKSPVAVGDPVVADYERHPFHLVKGSVATPAEGRTVRIITESQLFGDTDARGCLVIVNPETWALNILPAALDLGALGIITGAFTDARYNTPDALMWVNACAESNQWHVVADDRPFIAFSVSSRTADKLRCAAMSGDVLARVESDGARSEGVLPLVTARVPGKMPDKELWILSHLQEPLANDNSSGVAASIEAAGIVKKLATEGRIPPMEFSLRLVFGSECYGATAFAERMGGDLRGKVIGAMNTDGMPTDKPGTKLQQAPPSVPFFGDVLLEQLAAECSGESHPRILGVVEGNYGDDGLLSDPTIGVSTTRLVGVGEGMWHNSKQTMAVINPLVFAKSTAYLGAWTAAVVTLNRDALPAQIATAELSAKKELLNEADRILKQAAKSCDSTRRGSDPSDDVRERMLHRLRTVRGRLTDFRKVADLSLIDDAAKRLDAEADGLVKDLLREVKRASALAADTSSAPWFDYAATVTPARVKRGFPHGLIAMPKALRRKPCPFPQFIYSPYARILANMDGKKSLQRLIQELEWETGEAASSAQIKKYATLTSLFSDYGYLKTKFSQVLTTESIVAALRDVGVQEGDLLYVHSSLSKFGRIEGGAEAVIDAILDVIGDKGTVLFPTFTWSFIHSDGMPNVKDWYRPYDRNDASQVWVGRIPQVFLGREGVVRSVHPTHSVAGLGPLAQACVSEHREDDSPNCRRSPLGKLIDHNGKILHFGSGLGSTTFFHYLEDELDAPYLQPGACRVMKSDGTFRKVWIPKLGAGHRNVYGADPEQSKFFKRLQEKGLRIDTVPLGVGSVCLLDVVQLHELGIAAMKDDPNILLCDDPDCLFCARHKVSG